MIRSFKATGTEAELDFDVQFDAERRFHCLVGVNGVGKTHLIEHIARTFLYSHTMFEQPSSTARFAGAFFDATIQPALRELLLRMASTIGVDAFTIKHENDAWGVAKLEQIPPLRHAFRVDRPVVFVGARERGHTRNIEPRQLRLLGTHQDQFVAAFKKTWRAATGASLAVEEPAEWFSARMLINPAFAVGNEPQMGSVAEVLSLLKELDPREFGSLIRIDETQKSADIDLVYANGMLLFGGRPIDKLATGYISLLKIFQEIVAGYAAWNSLSEKHAVSSLRELDGVVFIDELEAHLHPQWQARIVDILKRSFPNTTFFVTTHSPLIVRQTAPGEAVEILRDGAKVTSRRLGSPRDWYLADVYADGFHVEILPPGEDSADGARPLGDVMLDFSNTVRDYTAEHAAASRESALALHAEIDARLANDDPRRRSLSLLRELLG